VAERGRASGATGSAVKAVMFALVIGVLGGVGNAHADTGTIRITIPGALAAPIGTSADGQVNFQIGVGLPVFLANASGAAVGGSFATATFARWLDSAPSTDFGAESIMMVFRLSDGFMAIATGTATVRGFVTTFSATPPYQTISGEWHIMTGPGATDVLVDFTFDTNSHIKNGGMNSFVAAGAATSVVTKSIPGVANVDVLKNIPVSAVVNNAKDGSVGTLASHGASGIVGHLSEVIELRTIDAPNAVLFVLYGCAAPTPSSPVVCLVGGTGFATHLSGTINEVAGSIRKTTISGVTDADLVLDLNAALP
jgi:hypothetical protein